MTSAPTTQVPALLASAYGSLGSCSRRARGCVCAEHVGAHALRGQTREASCAARASSGCRLLASGLEAWECGGLRCGGRAGGQLGVRPRVGGAGPIPPPLPRSQLPPFSLTFLIPPCLSRLPSLCVQFPAGQSGERKRGSVKEEGQTCEAVEPPVGGREG
eukprot:3414092-Rhodomonas_salina.1